MEDLFVENKEYKFVKKYNDIMQAVVTLNTLHKSGLDVIIRDDNGENPLSTPDLRSAGNLYSTEKDLEAVRKIVKKLKYKRLLKKFSTKLFLALLIIFFIVQYNKLINFESYINNLTILILRKFGLNTNHSLLIVLLLGVYFLFEVIYKLLRKKYPSIRNYASPMTIRFFMLVVILAVGIALDIISTSDLNYWANYLR